MPRNFKTQYRNDLLADMTEVPELHRVHKQALKTLSDLEDTSFNNAEFTSLKNLINSGKFLEACMAIDKTLDDLIAKIKSKKFPEDSTDYYDSLSYLFFDVRDCFFATQSPSAIVDKDNPITNRTIDLRLYPTERQRELLEYQDEESKYGLVGTNHCWAMSRKGLPTCPIDEDNKKIEILGVEDFENFDNQIVVKYRHSRIPYDNYSIKSIDVHRSESDRWYAKVVFKLLPRKTLVKPKPRPDLSSVAGVYIAREAA